MIIGSKRGGSAKNTVDVKMIGNKTSKAKGRITGGVLLKIGRIVRLVDDDEAEIRKGGKEGRARADNNNRPIRGEAMLPNLVALSFGLAGVDENGAPREGEFKDLDELGGEGDFGHEKDDRFTL